MSKYLFLLFILSTSLYAHHGVASLGVAGIRGPGAPVEASTSATLPEGSWLVYEKIEQARYRTFTTRNDSEKETDTYFMQGIGYGLTPYLSAYAFLPYNVKKVEDNSLNTAGAADLSFLFVMGFKYDQGIHLVPGKENLDDLEDWHFTLYGGGSLPTGNPNVRDASGNLDPGMSHGFGSPSYSLGLTAVKQLNHLTWVNDFSYLGFNPYTYQNDVRVRFGEEIRYNLAFTYRLHVNEEKKFRFDPVFEFQFLKIAADREQGISDSDKRQVLASTLNIPMQENAGYPWYDRRTAPWNLPSQMQTSASGMTVPSIDAPGLAAAARGVALDPSGGSMVYSLLGFRIYYKNTSFAFGAKFPVSVTLNRIPAARINTMGFLRGEGAADVYWNHIYNRELLSQGSEGMEKVRLIATFSVLL